MLQPSSTCWWCKPRSEVHLVLPSQSLVFHSPRTPYAFDYRWTFKIVVDYPCPTQSQLNPTNIRTDLVACFSGCIGSTGNAPRSCRRSAARAPMGRVLAVWASGSSCPAVDPQRKRINNEVSALNGSVAGWLSNWRANAGTDGHTVGWNLVDVGGQGCCSW